MIFFRPRRKEDFLPFISLETYEAVRIPGCEVVWADYGALARDFPFLAGLGESEIDRWILDHFSYLNRQQLELGDLRNTPIPHTDETIQVYRQSNFGPSFLEFQGRGDLVEVKDPRTGGTAGFVDRKGTGVSRRKLQENFRILEALKRSGQGEAAIQTRNLSNGLMYLGEALIEAAALKVTQRTFDLLNHRKQIKQPFPENPLFRNAPLQTIEGYFILKLPFELHAGSHGSQPAAIYARQAHVGRVWTGKVFTNMVNIKQGDFFFPLCDGGTVRNRLPELVESTRAIAGGPSLLQYQCGLDIMERYLKGERKALENTIRQVLAPVEEELQQADRAGPRPLLLKDGEEAFSALVDILEKDPIRFCRFAEVLWFAMKHGPEMAVRYLPRIQAIARTYLALPSSVKDIDDSQRPMSRWGFLLASCLPSKERRRVLALSLWSLKTEPEFLARSALLFPQEELSPFLGKIRRRAGAWMKIQLDSVLDDPERRSDPRRAGWRKTREWMERKGTITAPPVPMDRQKAIVMANLASLIRLR